MIINVTYLIKIGQLICNTWHKCKVWWGGRLNEKNSKEYATLQNLILPYMRSLSLSLSIYIYIYNIYWFLESIRKPYLSKSCIWRSRQKLENFFKNCSRKLLLLLAHCIQPIELHLSSTVDSTPLPIKR